MLICASAGGASWDISCPTTAVDLTPRYKVALSENWTLKDRLMQSKGATRVSFSVEFAATGYMFGIAQFADRSACLFENSSRV